MTACVTAVLAGPCASASAQTIFKPINGGAIIARPGSGVLPAISALPAATVLPRIGAGLAPVLAKPISSTVQGADRVSTKIATPLGAVTSIAADAPRKLLTPQGAGAITSVIETTRQVARPIIAPVDEIVLPVAASLTPVQTSRPSARSGRMPQVASSTGLTRVVLPATASSATVAATFATVVQQQMTAQSASERTAEADTLLIPHRAPRDPQVFEADNQGNPVLRQEVLALSPSPQALAVFRAEGFRVRRTTDLSDLGLVLVVLQPPQGMSLGQALRRVRSEDAGGQYDFNHLYDQAGGAGGRPVTTKPSLEGHAALRVGLIDSGVDAANPRFRGVRLVQRGFAQGGIKPAPHGLATASLMLSSARVREGAELFVADVYGGGPTGGSAVDIARALAWLAGQKAAVINVSLVGPPNIAVQAVISKLVARGHLIVAAVGNDGPAAQRLYPAAYPGVIAVTGINRRLRVIPEASRNPQVAFSAPGADLLAAGVRGEVPVRGTSFAAPIVAGRLAARLTSPDPKAAALAVAALGREATDLGPKGTDPTYGRGAIGLDLFAAPPELASRD